VPVADRRAAVVAGDVDGGLAQGVELVEGVCPGAQCPEKIGFGFEHVWFRRARARRSAAGRRRSSQPAAHVSGRHSRFRPGLGRLTRSPDLRAQDGRERRRGRAFQSSIAVFRDSQARPRASAPTRGVRRGAPGRPPGDGSRRFGRQSRAVGDRSSLAERAEIVGGISPMFGARRGDTVSWCRPSSFGTASRALRVP
jgi:hypothetical protein